ncbi:MAG TPA: hypothetical protein VMS31_15510 [Pyrinomonadaceae bacterium]|nr:hypothetical protein [Pyrinomonadaceae bacterium]
MSDESRDNHDPQIDRDESRELRRQVADVVQRTPLVDMHTHLFAPQFRKLNLSGIDELLTYHYLVAETFRSSDVATKDFWRLSKTQQADLVWSTLFVQNTPLSEATRGVVNVLKTFGLDPNAADLKEARDFFGNQDIEQQIDRVMKIAGVTDVVMTNDPFDPEEGRVWEGGVEIDPRFHAALRMDGMLNTWTDSFEKLTAQGYHVAPDAGGKTASEVRRFLDKWIALMKPLYMAVSLPDDFQYPDQDIRDRIIREVVLPTSREHGLPFALMIGVRRNVNPALRLAGDGMGRADVGAVERICVENPDVKFLVTMLSRENQHELCVVARKFRNLMPFGCWWFLNNPSIISEITRERLELLGPGFIPQHSDARVLEQLIYKWAHSRRVIADSLAESYEGLLADGRRVAIAEIERDVQRLFAGNFRQCSGMKGLTYEQGTA